MARKNPKFSLSALALAAALGHMGCGSESSTKVINRKCDSEGNCQVMCVYDNECKNTERCIDGLCAEDNGELESLVIMSGRTDGEGMVSLGPVNVRVSSERGPVGSAGVWYFSNGPKAEIITVASRDYLPSRVLVDMGQEDGEVVKSTEGLRVESRRQPLSSNTVEVVLNAINRGEGLYDILKEAPTGTLLSQDKYTREMCMTREQIIESAVEVPSSILEWMGVGGLVARIAGHFGPFKELFYDILFPEFVDYGDAKGYIVAIPKHKDVFSGEFIVNPQDGVLYGVSLEMLGEQIEKMPYWRIKGKCDPRAVEGCTYAPRRVCEGDDIVFLQDACGTLVEVERCGFEELCYAGECRTVDDEGLPECARGNEPAREMYCQNNNLRGIDSCGEDVLVEDCSRRRDEGDRRMICRSGECVSENGNECRMAERECEGDIVMEYDSCGGSREIERCNGEMYCSGGQCERRGPGRLEMTLLWDGVANLNLHVRSGDGCEVYYNMRDCGRGEMNEIGRTMCRGETTRENITYENARGGMEYLVQVNHYDRCAGPDNVPFRVEVSVDGELNFYEGEVSEGEKVTVVKIRYRMRD